MAPSQQQVLFAAEVLFLDLAANTSSNILIGHFSTTREVVVQHAPVRCPHPYTSRITGLNGVRSYFDLIATHWLRSDMEIHGRTVADQQVVVNASARWTWRTSGRSWKEEFVCTLDYDEHLKVVRMIIETKSGPGTCVMRAVDSDRLESGDLPQATGIVCDGWHILANEQARARVTSTVFAMSVHAKASNIDGCPAEEVARYRKSPPGHRASLEGIRNAALKQIHLETHFSVALHEKAQRLCAIERKLDALHPCGLIFTGTSSSKSVPAGSRHDPLNALVFCRPLLPPRVPVPQKMGQEAHHLDWCKPPTDAGPRASTEHNNVVVQSFKVRCLVEDLHETIQDQEFDELDMEIQMRKEVPRRAM
ncbi:hypothetical protein DFH07DRAFT_778450 [Mycena maculata]|uniref:Uncharacterized protein n=1 Tax=Mycena maculata TaxID=230809 RepID=A0AAD7N0H4_9AGAR|nr:hypothetical protein DFH07DRAFT_778450 [Mycena maculata]